MRDDLAESDTERTMVLIAYGLLLLGAFNGITALIGVVLAYVRAGDVRGTVWESHYRNIIAVFWIGLILMLFLIPLALTGLLATAGAAVGAAWLYANPMLMLPLLGLWLPLAMLAWAGLWIWFLYRSLRGLLRALDGRAC